MATLLTLLEGPGRTLKRTLRALGYRNYRLFFFGQLVSLVGSWMQSLAQAWLVWRLTHSAWLLGLVGFAQMSPILFFGLIGGLAADRFNRFKIVLWSQILSLVQAVILAALTLSGKINVWEIIALAAMLGIINAFSIPGRQAFIVQMVPIEDLGNAIALNSSVFNGARMIGPAIAGFVVTLWGEGACFVVNAVSFFAVIASLLMMKLEPTKEFSKKQGAWKQLVEGLAYSWRTPHTRALLQLVLLTSLFAVPFMILLPAISGGVLHQGAGGLGILMGFSGVGALSGAFTIAHRKGIRGLGRLVAYASIVFGATVILFGLSRSFYLSCALIVVTGYCMMTEMASTNTLLQSLVPDRLRGRLMSVFVITFVGIAPIGSLIEGQLADLYGIQIVLTVGGAIALLAGIDFRLRISSLRDAVNRIASQEKDGVF